MKNDRHAPEPWRAEISVGWVNVMSGDSVVCKCKDPADAQRIVAAVNFCEGFDAEALGLAPLAEIVTWGAADAMLLEAARRAAEWIRAGCDADDEPAVLAGLETAVNKVKGL